MKTLFILLILIPILALAADAPKLADDKKVSILQAQRDLIVLEAEKNALESRLKDIRYELMPRAQAELKERMVAAAPKGYTVQPDLSLVPEPASK